MSKSAKKRPTASAPAAVPTTKSSRHDAGDPGPKRADRGLEAIARHRVAAITHGRNDRSDDEGHRLVRGAQAPQARLEQDGRHTRSRAQIAARLPLPSPNGGQPESHAAGEDRSGIARPRDARHRDCAPACSRRWSASLPLAYRIRPPVSQPGVPAAGRPSWGLGRGESASARSVGFSFCLGLRLRTYRCQSLGLSR